jgi:branched-chain amino acid transport system permease protein
MTIDMLKQNPWKLMLPLGVPVVLCVLPIPIRSEYVLHLIIMSMIWAVAAAGWDLVWGYMGQFHFAQITLLGLGAYASSMISMHLSLPAWVSLLLAGLIVGVISICISFPALRLKPIYLAVVTFSFLLMVYYIARTWRQVTGGTSGIYNIPPLFEPYSLLGYYYIAVGLFAFSMGVMYGLVNSRYGLALRAIRSSEASASSIGVEITHFKILFFFISAFLTGLCGGFYAHYIAMLSPAILAEEGMIKIMVITEIGGLGSLYGSVIGSFLVTFLLEFFRNVEEWRYIIYGAALVLVIMIRPRGIYGGILDLVMWLRTRDAGSESADGD